MGVSGPHDDPAEPVRVSNANGRSPVILVCDHASNRIPPGFGTLGVKPEVLASHIAWDPGALAVAEIISASLDGPLVASTVSRLVIDCNRSLDAPDLVPEISDGIVIPGNLHLTNNARQERIGLAHAPFHRALDKLCAERVAAGGTPALIAIHSFTPLYAAKRRPWHIGLVCDDDRRLTDRLAEAFAALPGLMIGINKPYSPAEGVYYTIGHHASSNGFLAAMIEIRNDLLSTRADQEKWGSTMSAIVAKVLGLELSKAPSGPVIANIGRTHDHETGPPGAKSRA